MVCLQHLYSVALCCRLVLIIWGDFQDRIAQVRYTDVDYDVLTDAAAHILKGGSPYERATYRYTPALALLMLPNCEFNRDEHRACSARTHGKP